MNGTDNSNKEKVMAIRHEHFFSEALTLNHSLQSMLAHGIFLPVFEKCSSEDLLIMAAGALQNYILNFLFFSAWKDGIKETVPYKERESSL